ncbi:Shikimate dehydrogenase [Caprobacter fermentans]|uniref:Multifunctional fusion protein n=1 Tax=Caproicibacter fermentans TaxID=2576756 RepID=A0A6N8I3C4_9FIRM|nr:shikimate dehydrogenase [Caproicibacter fermentans]MVB12646.1 Shikimate dehydrogenase [Caproicibacter fermentans]QNK39204.1 shikimate dehydrogenase [Caproicibacter fermentans]
METLHFAVLGHPIGHTMSPLIHSRLFSLSGTAARYAALDVAPESLGDFLSGRGEWNGFNITIPHKRAIIPFLDSLDQKALLTGSVNTVRNEAGKLTGYTTDGDGFRLALEHAGVFLRDCRTVILGAGGAARAMAFETALAGGRVTVAAREHSLGAAKELCADLTRKIPGAAADACPIGEISGGMDLLVNATPAGMYPNVNSCAAEEDLIRRAGCVFDAVYNPDETMLIRLAEKNGIPAVRGMAMLVWQAAAAQTIWTGARFRAEEIGRLCGDAVLEMKKKFGNLVLCGFMGSGKTTVGRLLAEQTGRRFLDMDQWIEEKEGCSVAQIFTKRGESGFRALEREAACELSRKTGLVIAAGGGALLDPENARALRSGGTVILLDASLNAVRSRLEGDRTRPLLRDGGGELERLYGARLPVYRERADVAVPADGSPEETARLVLKALEPVR